MHRLSAFQGLAGLDVTRDGAFAVTGKLSTPLADICVPLRSAKYLGEVNGNPNVAAVITSPEIAAEIDPRIAVAVASDPDAAHSEIHASLAEAREAELKAQPTRIDASATIDPAARIAPYGVEIGARVRIGPNVVIAPAVTVEADCVLHPGVNLGVPGFNVGRIGGRQRIVPQMGGVRLKPFVELLANTCIARAIFGGDTTLGEETVTDNLVYIAHDVQIGREVQICALVNILGRAIIGDRAYIGPSAVIKNGVTLGEAARVSIGAVVTRDVAAGATVSGNFAIQHDRFLDHIRSIR
jgi:UDP-3-O-[3-hydroxymyristoyl] glucosamine N-acyltransferase